MSTDAGHASDVSPHQVAVPRTIPHRVVNFVVELALIVALLGELTAVVSDVFVRTFLHTSFLWADEISKLSLSALTFIGGAYAYERREHAFVRAVINNLSPRALNACLVTSDVFVIVIAAVAAVSSLPFVEMGWSQVTPVLNMPLAWTVLPLTVSMILVIGYAAEHLWRTNLLVALVVLPIVLALLFVATTFREAWLPLFSGDRAIVISVGLFLVAVLMGLPVGFGLLLSTVSYLWLSDTAPMVALPQSTLQRHQQFCSAGVALLCPRWAHHGAGRHQFSAGPFRPCAGRPPS